MRAHMKKGVAGLLLSILIYLFYPYIFSYQTSSEKLPILESVRQTVEKIIPKGTIQVFADEGVVKISFPRHDLMVTVQGRQLKPFMGLTSWVGFQQEMNGAEKFMAMGDLALLEDEVSSAIDSALAHNIHITALHNHFFYEKPKVYFMHIETEGTLMDIAHAINNLLEGIKEKAPQLARELPIKDAINGKLIEEIIGVNGIAEKGLFKVMIGRTIKTKSGCTIGKNMGINTWAVFSGTDDNALVDGDFALHEDEVEPVLRSLRQSKITVVAIHNHMLNEEPRMIFLHYWGQGKARDLAQAIKKALSQTTSFQS